MIQNVNVFLETVIRKHKKSRETCCEYQISCSCKMHLLARNKNVLGQLMGMGRHSLSLCQIYLSSDQILRILFLFVGEKVRNQTERIAVLAEFGNKCWFNWCERGANGHGKERKTSGKGDGKDRFSGEKWQENGRNRRAVIREKKKHLYSRMHSKDLNGRFGRGLLDCSGRNCSEGIYENSRFLNTLGTYSQILENMDL